MKYFSALDFLKDADIKGEKRVGRIYADNGMSHTWKRPDGNENKEYLIDLNMFFNARVLIKAKTEWDAEAKLRNGKWTVNFPGASVITVEPVGFSIDPSNEDEETCFDFDKISILEVSEVKPIEDEKGEIDF